MTELDGANYWLWRLEAPMAYTHDDKVIVVPEGFVSDGPSVPRPLWWLLPVWGRYGRAGVLHDYLCFRIDTGRPLDEAMTRKAADHLFLQAMVDLDINQLTRMILFWGVCFGRFIGVKTTMRQYNAMRYHSGLTRA